MKGAVLSAWIAASLALAASGARAQQADCDMICRLQGYLSTDHMAAESGGTAGSSSATPNKRHSRTAATAHPAVAAKAKPARDAKAGVEPPAKGVEAPIRAPVKTVATSAPAATSEPASPKAGAALKSKPAATSRAAPAATQPTNPAPALAQAPRHRVVTAIATPSDDAPEPAAVAPPHAARKAPAASHVARRQASRPATSPDLIPGGARLMPAEFQSFGKV